MTGLDKILAGIRDESAAAVDKIQADTDEKIASILRDANARADSACREIDAAGALRVQELAQRSASAAQLSGRKKLLQAKQDMIADVMGTALKEAEALPDGAYFDALLAMAARMAHPCAGTLCLSQKDLDRLPADFEAKLRAALKAPASLALSRSAAKIGSGFLLVYDGIEENCSFEAVFAAMHDELQDKVCKILFS